MINRKTFFAYVRPAPFGGRLLQHQIDGMNAILTAFEQRQIGDIRWLAYMLATAFHETAQTMQPIRERGGEAYLKSKPYYPWVGEGLVQVTWEANHRTFGATAPGQLLKMPIAIRAMFDGMIKGVFTGKALKDYFGRTIDDPVGARRIINGTDKARLIASYHKNFLDALNAALKPDKAAQIAPAAAMADDVPAHKSKSLATLAVGLAGSGTLPLVGTALDKGTSLVAAISNPYALAGFVFTLVSVAVLVWLIGSGRITINRSKAL